MINTMDPKTPSIMLVDDNIGSLNLLERVLSSQGYVSYKISTGKHAIAFAKNAHPDLILLDVTLPDINGFDVCTQLKADEELQHIPVIFISAIHNTFNQKKAISVGGADYITKPVDIDRLLMLVDVHIRNGQSVESISQ